MQIPFIDSLKRHFNRICFYLNSLLFVLIFVDAFLIVNGQIVRRDVYAFFLRAGMVISLACILIGLMALIVSKPRKYAVLNVFAALLLGVTMSYLYEGEPSIHYPGPRTYIPGPSH